MENNKFKKLFTLLIALLVAIPCGLKAVEIIDQSGEKVIVPNKIEKIVVLFPMAFGIPYILNIADRISGFPMQKIGIKGKDLGPFYAEISPQIASATDIGFTGSPNIETLLKIHPDLVVTSCEVQNTDTANKKMRENGITTIALKAGFGSIEEWLQAVEILGKATNRENAAKKYIDFFKQKQQMISERLKNTTPETWPKVALVNTTGGQMVIRGSRTQFGHELIKMAGGKLIDSGDDPKDSAGCAELMFAFDPDLIIDDAKVDTFRQASWWQELNAVKNKKVYKTPADDKQAWITNWSLSTYSPMGLLWLAKKIHPKEFADIDLRAEHKAFCEMLYGKDMPHNGNGYD